MFTFLSFKRPGIECRDDVDETFVPFMENEKQQQLTADKIRLRLAYLSLSNDNVKN